MFAVALIIVVTTIDYYNYNNYNSDPAGLYQGVFVWKSIAKPVEIGQRHHADDNDTVEDEINRNWYGWAISQTTKKNIINNSCYRCHDTTLSEWFSTSSKDIQLSDKISNDYN